jgi:hypothetical protein
MSMCKAIEVLSKAYQQLERALFHFPRILPNLLHVSFHRSAIDLLMMKRFCVKVRGEGTR